MKLWKFEITYGVSDDFDGNTYTLEVKRPTLNEAFLLAAEEAVKNMGVDYDIHSIEFVGPVTV